MYPAQSNFRSGEAGAAWWRERPPRGVPIVHATQWDAAVRTFQEQARRLIPSPVYVFPEVCGQVLDAAESLRGAWGIFTNEWRRTDQITADGRFGLETIDALGFLLCALGMGPSAARLSREKNARVISADTVRELLWIAFHIQHLDVDRARRADRIDLPLEALTLPPDVILPVWGEMVASQPQDLLWHSSFQDPESAPVPPPAPRAPSQGGPSAELRARMFPTAQAALVVGTLVTLIGAHLWLRNRSSKAYRG